MRCRHGLALVFSNISRVVRHNSVLRLLFVSALGVEPSCSPPLGMSTSHPTDSFLALSESKMYRDYAEAFVQGTGLPLNLSSPETLQLTCHEPAQRNPFCELLQIQKPGCAACYSLQCRVEHDAQHDANTLQCFAGLYETAVPVRVGGRLIQAIPFV